MGSSTKEELVYFHNSRAPIPAFDWFWQRASQFMLVERD